MGVGNTHGYDDILPDNAPAPSSHSYNLSQL